MDFLQLHLINAALPLRDERKRFELRAVNGQWVSIVQQDEGPMEDPSFIPFSDLVSAAGAASGASLRIDMQGRIVLPGLVDAHMHLDKAYTVEKVGNASGTLLEAIENYAAAAPAFSKEEIKGRFRKAALTAFSYGTTTIRTHLDYRLRSGMDMALRTLHAALEVKEELRGLVDIQLFPMCPYDNHNKAEEEAIEEALKLGVDGLGGAPHLSDTCNEDIDRIFAMAARFGKPIDLHADESDDPAKQSAAYIAAKTMEYGYQGKVTVGHLCSLSAMDEDVAARVIEAMKRAELGAVTLPAVNLYLQGRRDRGLVRRGTTRIKELLNASVPLAVASDNIQDPFHPFGQGDLLKIGWVAAYAAHMGKPSDLRALLRMITEIPASIVGREAYGIQEGYSADCVLMDAYTVDELFTEMPVGRAVFTKGLLRFTSSQVRIWSS